MQGGVADGCNDARGLLEGARRRMKLERGARESDGWNDTRVADG